MQTIAVIDYGMGNLRSVSKAVETVASDARVIVTSRAAEIAAADRVVCPGQGAARDCMAALNGSGLSGVIVDVIKSRPFLGICMGMQVLLSASDENDGISCLAVIPGQVRRFATPLLDEADGQRLKVPHMGWSPVKQVRPHPVWKNIPDQTRFYFAHSYYASPQSDDVVAASCHYGSTFAVALFSENVFACQFHPEKSADAGLQLLKNFTHWNGAV